MQADHTQRTGGPIAFRTTSGVLVTASTIHGGARLYIPVLATWARLRHQRQAA